ncbi:hypothetical protein VTK26DRAFT_6998 [Humicola hyalothermophila]
MRKFGVVGLVAFPLLFFAVSKAAYIVRGGLWIGFIVYILHDGASMLIGVCVSIPAVCALSELVSWVIPFDVSFWKFDRSTSIRAVSVEVGRGYRLSAGMGPRRVVLSLQTIVLTATVGFLAVVFSWAPVDFQLSPYHSKTSKGQKEKLTRGAKAKA